MISRADRGVCERITAVRQGRVGNVENPFPGSDDLPCGRATRVRRTPVRAASWIRNRDCRRTFSKKWFDVDIMVGRVDMTEPLPLLMDSSIEIAWDYLNRTGELGDAMVAGRFLRDTIELMVRRGERRRLMLANKAIAAYRQFRRPQSVPSVLASA